MCGALVPAELPEYRVQHLYACGCEVVIFAVTYADDPPFEVRLSRRNRIDSPLPPLREARYYAIRWPWMLAPGRPLSSGLCWFPAG